MSIKTEKQIVGGIGEDVAARFLVKRGFSVVCRNYRKKYGEIDIICTKDDLLHFVEVKTMTYNDVSRETSKDMYQPENNIHEGKLRRIGRTVEAYLEENDVVLDWMFHAVIVLLDQKNKIARIRFIEDIPL